MNPAPRWKLYISRAIKFVGALIGIGILGTIGFFHYDNVQIAKMTERFRDELSREPNGFTFVERNPGFFFVKLNEAHTPFRECFNVSRHPGKKGMLAIHSGEEFESGSPERAMVVLKKVRASQDCPKLTALYFKSGFRRVSVRLNIDSAGRLTAEPELHIWD